MHLSDLKTKSPEDLLKLAEELSVENASSLKKQDLIYSILRKTASNKAAVYGDGVVETLPDGFAFLRSPQANYMPGPDDIYISPGQVRRLGVRTGDTIEG